MWRIKFWFILICSNDSPVDSPAVTMLLLVASFKYDGNGAFGENIKNPQRLFYKCQKTVTKFSRHSLLLSKAITQESMEI